MELLKMLSDEAPILFGAVVVFIMLSQLGIKVLELVIGEKRHKQRGTQHACNAATCEANKAIATIKPQIEELHRMHSVTDNNGRPLWWNDPETKSAISKSVEATTELVTAMRMLQEVASENTKALNRATMATNSPQ